MIDRRDQAASERPIVEVKYTLEEADLVAGVSLTPGTPAKQLRWPVLAVVVLVSVILEWVLREPDQLPLGLLAAIGVSALVFWVPASQRRSQVRRAFRAIPVAARTLRVRLFTASLRVEDGEHRIVDRPWAEVTAAVRHADAIFVYAGLQTVVLPGRALANLDTAVAFLIETLGSRFHRRRSLLDWEMAANLGIWAAAASAGVLYAMDSF
jgi:hypothetical protein